MELEDLVSGLWWVLGGLVLVLVLCGVLVALAHRRVLRRGAMDESEADRLRAALVDAVKDASTELGMRVDTRRFWKGSGYTAAQRYVTVAPLLRDRVLSAPRSEDAFERALQFVQYDVLARAPYVLTLNSRDWTRMANGESAGVVVHGSVGVVQTGSGQVRVGQLSQRVEGGLDAEFLRTLVAAIRVDASRMGPSDAQRALSRADAIENDVAKNRFESACETAGEVLETASKAAGLWATVAGLLS